MEITFQDGKVMRYDIAVLFDKHPQLEALKDRKIFTSGKLTTYGIIWNEDLDLDAETVYEDGRLVRMEEPSICKEVGRTLSDIRSKKNISQKELAALIGMDQSDISKIERGVMNPSLQTLERIAEALGVRPVIVFQDNLHKRRG